MINKDTEMWEWLLECCRNLAHKLCLPENIKDDVISETILRLYKEPETAARIYSKKEEGLLCYLLKQARNETNKLMFEDHRDYSRYKKILSVCNEYNIEYNENNAHIFAYILSDKDFTISRIISVMRKQKPTTVNYYSLEEQYKI